MHFHKFSEEINSNELPKRFNYPFNYEPHELSQIAAESLQLYIKSELALHHNFDEIGKMFGVLVVKNINGDLGFLAAFSGKLGGKNDYPKFVPPVYDMLTDEGFYRKEEIKINEVSIQIQKLETDAQFILLESDRKLLLAQSSEELKNYKYLQKQAKASRNLLRKETIQIPESEQAIVLKNLDRESANLHYGWKELNKNWQEKLFQIESKLTVFNLEIDKLKQKRKQMSLVLQNRLFDNYTFLNAHLNTKSVKDLFLAFEDELPPSGAGECAAPKLLQYAYLNKLKPIALAEFWWGKSPNSEIRKQGYFYPACKTKCLPILTHMLEGLDVDPNPLMNNPAQVDELEVIYEDIHLIVINKPYDFLSVPGRNIQDSVFTRLKKQFPQLHELMAVHRLDMSTSGLMLIAKTKAIHKALQQQFERRTIKKRYVAILDGIIEADSGEINLPLIGDYEHRPRQKVCFENGKQSMTKFEVISREHGKTRVFLYPLTGRTHQLRVHAAHKLGLNTPIYGDDLYGLRSNRLHLHAEAIEFHHPVLNQTIQLEVKAKF